VPGVVELSAVAVNDAEWGQRVAIVYLGSPEVADNIAEALADTLGPAGKPVRVVRVDKIPRLANSKPDLIAIKQILEGN
jgi:O-succinylbenzoic acid--CoA ligase